MLISFTVPSCPAHRHEVPPGFWDGLSLPALQVDLSFGFGCLRNYAGVPDEGVLKAVGSRVGWAQLSDR